MTESIILPVEDETINCGFDENIHIPGAIQPHGVVVVLSLPDLTIVQISHNCEDFLGLTAKKLLGKNLTSLFHVEQLSHIYQCLEKDFTAVNPLVFSRKIHKKNQYFNGLIHRQNDLAILELERREEDRNEGNILDFYQINRNILKQLHQCENIRETAELIVQKIQDITEFDRVMVYKFDEDLAGDVIAEAKRDHLESFLGLHYPATDIPEIARRLFYVNGLRTIPNVNYDPVLLPNHSLTNEPIDLGFSILRSVSPVHIEYLQNMGVQATMMISLVNNKKLWGLIACHHYEPKHVPYEIRTICEFIGRVVSLELSTKEENEILEDKLKRQEIRSQLANLLNESEDFLEALIEQGETLQTLTNATGVALSFKEKIHCFGKTPTLQQIETLLEWLPSYTREEIFQTHTLPSIYSPAIEFKAVGSGLLVLNLARIPRHFVLWFRPEIVETVNWAGAPDSSIIEVDGSLQLTPRKSFELWKELVGDRSSKWQNYEIEQVIELRNNLTSLIIQETVEELALMNIDLERSNTELDSFTYIASHDLKEPLRGIHNYSTFLLEDYGELLDEEGVERVKTLINLSERMEGLIEALLHYSRIGRSGKINVRFADLNSLLKNVQKTIHSSYPDEVEIIIPDHLPRIECDPILLEEVFVNLIANGIKYNKKELKNIEIGYLYDVAPSDKLLVQQESLHTFYVKDNGIGIDSKHFDNIFRIFKRLHGRQKYGGGTGVGLTIVKKIITLHGGQIWLDSTPDVGTTIFFSIATHFENKNISSTST